MKRSKRYVTVPDVDRWLRLLAEGSTIQEVADQSGFAVATIRYYTK